MHEACRQQRRGAGSGWTDGVTGCKRKREVAESFVVEKLGGSFVGGLIERQSEIRSELELIVEEGVQEVARLHMRQRKLAEYALPLLVNRKRSAACRRNRRRGICESIDELCLGGKRNDTGIKGRDIDPESAVDEGTKVRQVAGRNKRRHKVAYTVRVEQNSASACAASRIKQRGARFGAETTRSHKVGEERGDNLMPSEMKSEWNVVRGDVTRPCIRGAILGIHEVSVRNARVLGSKYAAHLESGWPLLGRRQVDVSPDGGRSIEHPSSSLLVHKPNHGSTRWRGRVEVAGWCAIVADRERKYGEVE